MIQKHYINALFRAFYRLGKVYFEDGDYDHDILNLRIDNFGLGVIVY